MIRYAAQNVAPVLVVSALSLTDWLIIAAFAAFWLVCTLEPFYRIDNEDEQ